MEIKELTRKLILIKKLLISRKNITIEELKQFIKDYYDETFLSDDFYNILKNNLSNNNIGKIIKIILKGNIYELISHIRKNNEAIDCIQDYLTPQKYLEIPKRQINKLIEELKKLPTEPNELSKQISEESIWLLKRPPSKTEEEYKQIAYKMYQSIGYENSIELLLQKYGSITYEQIHYMFINLETKNHQSEQEKTAFINFLFANKKDFNNTIKQMLNGRFYELFLNFDYFYNNISYFTVHLGTKMSKLKVKKLLDDRFLTHDVSTPEITGNILDDMLSSYYCKYETLDTPKDDIYQKNYDIYNAYLRKKHQSSIPRIKISSQDEISVEILKLNDPRNLVIGYRAGNCFRINGDAAFLFKNFLLSDHMRILTLSTKEQKDFAMMLIMRNGNVLIGQGIEISKRAPREINNETIYNVCKDSLKQLMEYMNSEKDEIVSTIIGSSNSNVSDYNSQILPFLISPILELSSPFYNGIYNYQCLLDLNDKKTLHDIKLFIPNKRYSDERNDVMRRSAENPNYEHYMDMEKMLIALRFARQKKEENYLFYEQLITKRAIYTSCNNDWYAILFDDGTVDSYIMDPTNTQAREEYETEIKKLKQKTNNRK